MESCDIVCSLPCLSWNLAPLFYLRLNKYKGSPFCSPLFMFPRQAVECYAMFSWSTSPVVTALPNTLVVSLWSSDLISQQQLAQLTVPCLLRHASWPWDTASSKFPSSVLASPFPCWTSQC